VRLFLSFATSRVALPNIQEPVAPVFFKRWEMSALTPLCVSFRFCWWIDLLDTPNAKSPAQVKAFEVTQFDDSCSRRTFVFFGVLLLFSHSFFRSERPYVRRSCRCSQEIAQNTTREFAKRHRSTLQRNRSISSSAYERGLNLRWRETTRRPTDVACGADVFSQAPPRRLGKTQTKPTRRPTSEKKHTLAAHKSRRRTRSGEIYFNLFHLARRRASSSLLFCMSAAVFSCS
jgi:hypothetical protein